MRLVASASLGVLVLAAGTVSAAEVGHYLFAWAGDPTGAGEDFIAVINADPASSEYGKLVASAASEIRSQQVHHTEYWMPDSGLLFANDHMAGNTVVMDLRE